mmetsp:Transcript_41166/g.66199  ORF Transcript_41166/g.66199 Transcript_41166/m.66199 type:complete len:227 (-) Transcript_41166:46-726(-)
MKETQIAITPQDATELPEFLQYIPVHGRFSVNKNRKTVRCFAITVILLCAISISIGIGIAVYFQHDNTKINNTDRSHVSTKTTNTTSLPIDPQSTIAEKASNHETGASSANSAQRTLAPTFISTCTPTKHPTAKPSNREPDGDEAQPQSKESKQPCNARGIAGDKEESDEWSESGVSPGAHSPSQSEWTEQTDCDQNERLSLMAEWDGEEIGERLKSWGVEHETLA